MPSRSLAVCAWACDETTASGSGTGQQEPQHSPASWLSASIETEPGQLQPLQHLLCNTFDAIDTHAFDVCVFAQPPLDQRGARGAAPPADRNAQSDKVMRLVVGREIGRCCLRHNPESSKRERRRSKALTG
jgi:hypothetical protein